MVGRIFPKQFDNNYRGARLAIWLFIALIFVKFMMGFNSIFFTRFVATSADGLNLGAYGPLGAEAVLSLYTLLGLSLVLLALIGVTALVRYRSMIPFLYLVLLIQQVAGKALAMVHPIGGSPGAGNPTASAFVVAALAVTVVGFVLSLWWRPRTQEPALAQDSP